jgi:8-amino-7-oxononanoate synthase
VSIAPSLARSSLDDVLSAELVALDERQLRRHLRATARRDGARVVTAHGEAIDFSSNDYLGLASDPRLADAALSAMRAHGIGAGAARLISGNTPEHDALDRDLAAWFVADCAVSFSSGYAANIGIIPALVGRGDVIFSDALNHASLIDGCRLSRATVYVYPHRDVRALSALLATHRGRAGRALIVSEGVFSMDGDRAPLDAIAAVSRRFDAWTYVDDAHAVGVVGPGGRGTAASLGVSGEIDVAVGTLGKAFGGAGAFVYGSRTLCHYLINKARSFVFSTGMPPGQAGAAREALRLAAAEPWRRERVRSNARLLRERLARRGVRAIGDEDGHMVPIVVGSAARTSNVAAALAARGYLVGGIRPPTVPDGTARLRVTVHALHADEEIDSLAEILANALNE